MTRMGDSGTLLVFGASRGIGAATARLGARRGYRVALAYASHPADARATANDITAAGGQCSIHGADIADAAEVERLFDEVTQQLGVVTAVANCAGINGGQRPMLEHDAASLARVVAVNLLGAMHCTQSAALRMARSAGGSGGAIVHVSSEAARFGGNRFAPYAAAKAGINTWVIATARELAPEGIRINAVSPGIIETDQQADISPDRRAELMRSLPLGRMGSAEEVARSILWLLSDESSYVTGSILTVAGGR
jgi:NAD(P)-dependent dehydrogenase (short-subunit alcohol dehydrogenase family)